VYWYSGGPRYPYGYAGGPASLYTSPYTSQLASDPYGSMLRGSADVISAQSRYLVTLQEAQLLREQVQALRTANRRSAFDHYLYVRERAPTPEQLRAEERAQRLDRARNEPPVTEILSAGALNELLADLQQATLTSVQDLPIDAALVRYVNFTTARDSSNIGLLRNCNLRWPRLLAEETFETARDRLNLKIGAAIEQAKSGVTLDRQALVSMSDDIDALHLQLRGRVSDVAAPQFIEGKRFLNQLGDAVKALEQPDAIRFLSGSYDFKGQTVNELVKFMTENGLWFAPATGGDEPAYRAVHHSLAVCSLIAHTRMMQTSVAKK
jgi:hypothetical protein